MNEQDKKQKILIVDDVPENIDILMETLMADYRLIAALDGERALKLAISQSPPDLILLDIMMPGIDGYEVCKRLKANEITKNIPVLFLTALTEEQDEARGLALGAVDYITKPFSPELIKARVRNHLELKQYQDRLENLVRERTLQLKEALENLKMASLDTILRLSRAAEYKDEDTGAHILRISAYAEAMVTKLGYGKKVAMWTRYAAPMHDVGKIGIPDNILLKPGKLTAREWEIMKQHTTIGSRILGGARAGYLRLAEIIALTHHEKWDGSGYPKGLSGKKIPRIGQIVAISDVFDALTSKRPYKEPFSIKKSFGIIRAGRGGHFDPEIVDVFFQLENRILEIKKTYRDQGMSRLQMVVGDSGR